MKIGIDAGGTKTYALLFNENQVVAEVSTGMGNVIVNFDEAINNIIDSIFQLLQKSQVKLNQIECISVGCAGVSSVKSVVLTTLQNKLKLNNIIVKTDLEMSHIATFGNGNGTMLIAGTGSSILSRHQDQFIQKGGWGHLLGDEGSAYWIGKQILLTYIQYLEDGIVPKDFEKMLPKLKSIMPTRLDIIDTVYRKTKDQVAALAVLVDEVNGDYTKNLIEETARQLVNLLERTVMSTEPLLLALEGSVVVKNMKIRQYFIQKINDIYTKGVTICETKSGAYAVLYIESEKKDE